MVIRYAGLFIVQQFKMRRRPEILKSYARNLDQKFTFYVTNLKKLYGWWWWQWW